MRGLNEQAIQAAKDALDSLDGKTFGTNAEADYAFAQVLIDHRATFRDLLAFANVCRDMGRGEVQKPVDSAWLKSEIRGGESVLRWLLNISQQHDKPNMRISTAIDRHCSWGGVPNREVLERLWSALALLTTTDAGITQADWKLVPVEPTEKMLEQGSRANYGPRSTAHGYIYKSMLAAAPSHPGAGKDGEA